jgi:trk system potassium uptake protein TrkA
MKVIIIGAGDVGYNIGKTLIGEKKDVIFIDPDEEAIRRVRETLDVQAIKGSGSNPEILREAGIEKSDMLIAVTDSDEVNMIACLIAESLAKIHTKIARVRNEAYSTITKIFDRNHLDIDLQINPEKEAVKNILSLMEFPGTREVIDLADGKIRLVGIEIDDTSPFVGKTLEEIRISNPEYKILVIAIDRNHKVIIPKGKDLLLSGDHVFIIAEANKVFQVLRFMRKDVEQVRRVIIFGGGNIALYLAKEIEKRGHISTKLICPDEKRCHFFVESLEKTIVLLGDGTDDLLLREENIKECDFFIAISEDEEANVLASLLAKQLGATRVMTLVNRLAYIPLISTLGVDYVINPQLAAVDRILRYIRKGKVLSVASMREQNAEVIEVVAMETSDLVNRPLKMVGFPKDAIVGAIVRGKETIIPHGGTIVEPGDRVIIFALKSAIKEVEKALMVKLEYF